MTTQAARPAAPSVRFVPFISALIGGVACAVAVLLMTGALPYYPAAWRTLVIAAVLVAWWARPAIGVWVTLVALAPVLAYNFGLGAFGVLLAGLACLSVALLVEPFGLAVIAGLVALALAAPEAAGLLIVAPFAFAAQEPRRAAWHAGLFSVGLLTLSMLAGRSFAPDVLAAPVGQPIIGPQALGVASLLDTAWLSVDPGSPRVEEVLSGLVAPFLREPILIAQVALWSLVAWLTSMLWRSAPWSRISLRGARVPRASAWRGSPAVLFGGAGLAAGELVVVSAFGPSSVSAGSIVPALAIGVIAVGLFLPALGAFALGLRRARTPGEGMPSPAAPLPGTPERAHDAFRRESPRDSWDELAGVDGIRAELGEVVSQHFDRRVREHLRALALEPPHGVLLFGPPGTGKTKIARVMAATANASFFAVSGSEFASPWFGDSEANLRRLFDAARSARPAIVFFDELEAVLPKRAGMSRADAPEKRIVATFLGLTAGIDDLEGVLLVGATNHPELIDDAALRPGRFDKLIYVAPPDHSARRAIFERHLGRRPLAADVDLGRIVERTERFTGADIAAVCAEAARGALRRMPSGRHGSEPITMADLEAAISGAKPSVSVDAVRAYEALADRFSRRSEVRPDTQVIERPTLGWDDVAGLADVKAALRDAIELPLEHPDLLRDYGLRPARGVLLFGPPGCGKTYLAKVVASSAGAHFIDVRGPELLQSLVGESESRVRALFARARENAPCVLFFDELDAIAGARGSVDAGRTQILTQLLVEMDGLDGLKGVIVVAATNRPDSLDPALLRPGRFDRVLYVPPPDEPARRTIFEHELARRPIDPDLDFDVLAKATDGYSAADIAAITASVALEAAKESLAGGVPRLIDADLLLAHVSMIPPSISRAQIVGYEAIQRQLAR